ncbi:MAG: hypothetical protein IKN64_03650 [Desulfovibrio sp.]|nr:hypothetical protein [Desulfovibrio sp.]
MQIPGLILAAILALSGKAEAFPSWPEGSVSYAAYHSEWGEQLAPVMAQSIHLELTQSRLNVSLTGNMPSLIYTGPVDVKIFQEISDLLRSMDPDSWPGATGDENRGTRRKDQCEWEVLLAVKEPRSQRKRVYGSDKGRDTPRLACEARLCTYFKELLPKLYASVPKTLQHLTLNDRPAGGYWSVGLEEGRVRVCVIRRGEINVEFYTDPSLLKDLRSLLDTYGAEAWHGSGYGRYEAGKMPLYFEVAFSTRQPLLVMADQEHMPKGFAAFTEALREKLAPLAKRWQACCAIPAWGLKEFSFAENGMRMEPSYKLYRRLDREGVRVHIMRTLGGSVEGDVPLSEAEEKELADILRSLSDWDGFTGNARNVLDATGFGLNVAFADGRSISASGYGMFPKGYREGKTRFLDFLEKRLPKSER